MLKIKADLVTTVNDKKEKSQSWQAHFSYNDGFYNGTYQCDLIDYGASE